MDATVAWLQEQAEALLHLVRVHQFPALFLALLVEEMGVPLPAPGDLIMVYFASRHRDDPTSLLGALALGVLASTLGANVPYALARRFGDAVVHRAARWLDVDEAAVERGRRHLRERGALAVLLLRIIPGMRLPIALLAGGARVDALRYVMAVFGAAVVYWSVWILVGVLFGTAVDAAIERLQLRLLLPLVALLGIGFIVFRRIRARRSPSGRSPEFPPTRR